MIKVTFTVEKDTKNTRRYAENEGETPPKVGTLYVQKWALKQLTGGELPDKIKVTIEVVA